MHGRRRRHPGARCGAGRDAAPGAHARLGRHRALPTRREQPPRCAAGGDPARAPADTRRVARAPPCHCRTLPGRTGAPAHRTARRRLGRPHVQPVRDSRQHARCARGAPAAAGHRDADLLSCRRARASGVARRGVVVAAERGDLHARGSRAAHAPDADRPADRGDHRRGSLVSFPTERRARANSMPWPMSRPQPPIRAARCAS